MNSLIGSDQQRKQCERNLNLLLRLRREIVRIGKNYEIDDEYVELIVAPVDQLTEDIRQQLTYYHNLIRSGGLIQSGWSKLHILQNVSELQASLKEGRRILGWTQKELAKQAKINAGQICRFEQKNYSNVPMEKVTQIAAVIAQALEEASKRSTHNNSDEIQLECPQ